MKIIDTAEEMFSILPLEIKNSDYAPFESEDCGRGELNALE